MEKGKQSVGAVAWLQKQQQLLRMEYNYEKEEFRRQTETRGVDRLVRRGLCWYPVVAGRNYFNSLNQMVLEITRSIDEDIEHNFEYGRPVCFFEQNMDGSLHYFNSIGTVSYVESSRMVVAINESALIELQSAHCLGVQLYFDETSYSAMFDALTEVIAANGDRLALLREVLLGTFPTTSLDLYPVHFPWLNDSQEEAINRLLASREVAIIHGPPGTGKTTTLVEAIYETLRRETQILVCAQSNTAVDWISEMLVDRGVPVLRIGNPTRVNDKMLSFTYEKQFERHPAYTELWGARKAIRDIYTRMRKSHAGERETLRNHINRLRERVAELEININNDLFSQVRVVASTLIGSNNKVLTGHHFSTLFIDEVAQALEAACWVAIRKCDRVVLAGDHYQLPPTIKCIEAAREGLDYTLMEKVASNKPNVVSMLTMQYRMHRDIMRFSSDWFYHGQLTAAPEVDNRSILSLDRPMVWIDTSSLDYGETLKGESRFNQEEADLLIRKFEEYVQHISRHRIIDEALNFGIISPYKAQVQYLRGVVKRSSYLRPVRDRITINTVDGFQGQERDVIFISLVRSNENGTIGFMKDLRRMNVAMTRARMKLVILGNAETMGHHPFYRKLLNYISTINQEIK